MLAMTTHDGASTKTIAPTKLHSSLASFESLPSSAFVQLRVVCTLFCCSPATVWRRVRSGELVAPHRIGARTTRWQVGELRAALACSTK